jgi:formylglycine-generating enzyme required for sulfatase activity
LNPKRVRILFAPENRGVAGQIASALHAAGREAALDCDGAAHSAIVIWSPASSQSPAVIDCARQALAARVLVPVSIGKAPPPASFEHLWPMDIAGWCGDPQDPRWRFVLEELEIALRRNIEVDLIADLSRASFAEPRVAATAAAARRVYAAPVASPLVGFSSPRRSVSEPAFRLIEPPVESPPADDIATLAETPPCDDPILLDDERAVEHFEPLPKVERPAVRLTRAPFIGAAFVCALVISAAAAYFVGARTPGPKVAEDASRPPVVAYVEPLAPQRADELAPQADELQTQAATGPADEEFEDVYADAKETEAPVDAAALRAGPAPADAAQDVSAPRVKPSTIATLAEDSLEAQASAAQSAADSDPIAGLAWEATRTAAAEETYFGNYFRECVDCPDMAVIEAGVFSFGSPADERGRSEDEGQIVDIAINRRFAIATREITFEQWDACVSDGGCPARAHDSGFGRGKMPAINVSWNDARAYVVWLSRKTGGNYRLPTEAEWEYAARGAQSGPFSFGAALAADKANYNGSRPYAGERAINRARPLPVGSFPPNPYGLFDMHGNVAEWTADCWTAGQVRASANGGAVGGSCDLRVVKGGAWNSPGAELRAAARKSAPRSLRQPGLGVRVVRDLD